MSKIVLDNPVFQNERYGVILGDFPGVVKFHGGEYTSGYCIINKDTGVTEVCTPQLPDAIAAAEQLDIACANETWKWARINFEAEMYGEAQGPTGPAGVH